MEYGSMEYGSIVVWEYRSMEYGSIRVCEILKWNTPVICRSMRVCEYVSTVVARSTNHTAPGPHLPARVWCVRHDFLVRIFYRFWT